MTINDVIEQVYRKQSDILVNSDRYNLPKLAIYIGEDLYHDLKAQIKGEQTYAAVTFHQDDVILGHRVYRVINAPHHFKIFEV